MCLFFCSEVRNRISFKAEAARVWAAVLSWQLLERLLRDEEKRGASCTAATGGAAQHISTDPLEL